MTGQIGSIVITGMASTSLAHKFFTTKSSPTTILFVSKFCSWSKTVKMTWIVMGIVRGNVASMIY